TIRDLSRDDVTMVSELSIGHAIAVTHFHTIRDLSRDDVTMVSELSIGHAIAVTQSVWARIVPRRTSESAMVIVLGGSCENGKRKMEVNEVQP
nr:hypothetical protein CCACVL1_19128 [Tanacetum cinerariifolium]